MRPPLLTLVLLGLGCATAQPVVLENLPQAGAGLRIDKIAVAPFQRVPQVERVGARVSDVEPEALAVVRSRVVEALSELGDLDYVPPEQIELWLQHEQLSLDEHDPAVIGAELARAFGADAILYGRVRRYSSRVGGPRGVRRPAAVWFELELRLPDGKRIWAGTYNEQQQSISEDLFSLPRAIERGFKWVDAPRLASYGARELVHELAQERVGWR